MKLLLAVWGVEISSIFRMFLSEHPEDSNCLLAAETHDSQTKLMQSKIQLTVFSNL